MWRITLHFHFISKALNGYAVINLTVTAKFISVSTFLFFYGFGYVFENLGIKKAEIFISA
jgi:hypothetical protein